jgi:hypothetical protein
MFSTAAISCQRSRRAEALELRAQADEGSGVMRIGILGSGGGIESSRLLEPMCVVWVLYGIRGGGWDHAFKLLRK